ncbi:hypothetical protein CRENBAI_005294, partial [Crenichthys baileyi]
MCWLPIDQPLLRPGDSSCSASRRRSSACSVAQLLASRLRRIGDQLEKRWTAGETPGDLGCGETVMVAAVTGRGHFKGFLCLAVHVTLLVLLGARRHL